MIYSNAPTASTMAWLFSSNRNRKFNRFLTPKAKDFPIHSDASTQMPQNTASFFHSQLEDEFVQNWMDRSSFRSVSRPPQSYQTQIVHFVGHLTIANKKIKVSSLDENARYREKSPQNFSFYFWVPYRWVGGIKWKFFKNIESTEARRGFPQFQKDNGVTGRWMMRKNRYSLCSRAAGTSDTLIFPAFNIIHCSENGGTTLNDSAERVGQKHSFFQFHN